MNKSTRTLVDAVYDHPDDDAPREALSAHLVKLGDPRGDFIAIQLAEARGAATAALSRRAAALLEEHRDAWLVPYEGIFSVRWRRGFPVHGFSVMFRDPPRPWRTVRSLVVDLDTRYRFLRGPLVENLRELTWRGWYPGSFAPFCKDSRLPMLETLRWCGLYEGATEEYWRKGYERFSKFKRLTEIELEPGGGWGRVRGSGRARSRGGSSAWCSRAISRRPASACPARRRSPRSRGSRSRTGQAIRTSGESTRSRRRSRDRRRARSRCAR